MVFTERFWFGLIGIAWALVSIGFIACEIRARHLEKVVTDQRIYIENGCYGRYEGNQ